MPSKPADTGGDLAGVARHYLSRVRPSKPFDAAHGNVAPAAGEERARHYSGLVEPSKPAEAGGDDPDCRRHQDGMSRAPLPLIVTDATSLVVCGLTPRQFRTFVRAAGIPSAKIARRTAVRADVLLAALDRLSGVPTAHVPVVWDEAAAIERAAR